MEEVTSLEKSWRAVLCTEEAATPLKDLGRFWGGPRFSRGRRLKAKVESSTDTAIPCRTLQSQSGSS